MLLNENKIQVVIDDTIVNEFAILTKNFVTISFECRNYMSVFNHMINIMSPLSGM